MSRTYGNWKIGNYPSVVVTDQRTSSFQGYFDREEWERYELDNYGGYVLCESVHSPEDALVIAAASDLLDACKQILAGVETVDIFEFFNGLNSARAAIQKAEPSPKLLSEFSQETLNRVHHLLNLKNQ